MDKYDYFSDFDNITVEKCKELLNHLEVIEANNDWLPSPHTISPYIEYLEVELYASRYEESQLDELCDKLCYYHRQAYEQ